MLEDIAPWAEEARELPRIGVTGGQPNLEEVLTYNPDLLVGRNFELEQIYGVASQAIPTVAIAGGGNWREAIRIIGEATGCLNVAEEVIAQVEADVTEVATRIDEATGGEEIVVALANQYQGQVGLANPGSGGGSVLGELGLTLFSVDGFGDSQYPDIGLERVDLFEDADVILLEDFTPEQTETLLASPLWQQLEIVKEQRVTRLSPIVTRAGAHVSVRTLPFAAEAYAEGIIAALDGKGSVEPRDTP